MVKTRRRSGGKKRKTRCWRRRRKNGSRYTVCRGSRGEKGKYKKKRRTKYAKKRLRQRGGYSGINVPLSPANFQGPSQPTLPPFGPVNVPVRGVTKVHDGEYYYAKNNRVIGAPKAGGSTWGKPTWAKSQKGGRKKRRGRRRRCPKTGKKICYCKPKRKRKRRQRGGSTSSVVNAIPGGSDVRDVYWSAGNKLVNLWDNWNGFGSNMSTNAAVQPIGRPGNAPAPASSMPTLYQDAGLQASKAPYQAYNS